MLKLNIITFAIASLFNIKNASITTQGNDAYNYGIPVQISNKLDLSHSTNDLHNFTSLYSTYELAYFNKSLTSQSFLDSFYNSYSNTSFNTDTLPYIYNDITGNYPNIDLDTLRLDINLVLGGYVDTNGTFVDLSLNPNVFYFTTIATLQGQGEYNYTITKRQYSTIFRYEILGAGQGVTSTPTNLNRNYLNTCPNVYLLGFFGAQSNYTTEQITLDYMLQVSLYYLFNNAITNYNNSPIWFNDGYYTNYQNTYNLNYYYPYYYNNLYDINTYYYRGSLNTSSNRWYIPNNTVIYNGWFSYNNTYYDTLFNTYKLVAVGQNIRPLNTAQYISEQVSINNTEYTLQNNEYIVIFDALIAYNSVNNSYTAVLVHNYEQNTNIYTIKNNFNFLNDIKIITFYNVYHFGTNYALQYYYNYDYVSINLGNSYLFTNTAIFNENKNNILINSLTYTNYIDNLIAKPNGAGNNLGNVTGTIIDNNTNILTNVFDLYGGALNAITSFLNFAVFPGITLGLLLLVPLIITLIITIVKLFKR